MLEKKTIYKGQGYRITGTDPETNRSMTLVVRLPRRTHLSFVVRSVVTDGIQGQPQLTFDTLQNAKEFLEHNPNLPSYLKIGWINKDYDCIKIPVTCEDGTVDAWLAESNFPEQDSPKWKWLADLFPDYFLTNTTEDINTKWDVLTEDVGIADLNAAFEKPYSLDARDNWSDSEIRNIMNDPNLTEDQKAERLFNRTAEHVVTFGRLSFDTAHTTVDLSGEIDPYLGRIQLASRKKDDFSTVRVSTLFVQGEIYEPFTLQQSWDYYVEGKQSQYHRSIRGTQVSPIEWWKYITQVVCIWERAIKICGYKETKRGFFTEELSDDCSWEEIRNIALDPNLTDDQKCQQLWGTSWEKTKKASDIFYWINLWRFPTSDGESKKEEALRKIPKDSLGDVLPDIKAEYESICRNFSPGPWTVFMNANYLEPLNVEESFKKYAEGRLSSYVHSWFKYVKKLIRYYNEISWRDTPKGFFTENYSEIEVPTHEAWKIKTPGQYCYRIKINIPNSRFRTFRWAKSRMSAYGGGPGDQEAFFKTKEEAEEFIRVHNLGGEWYAYSSRIPLTLVKIPLEDGTECYLRREAFPREFSPWTDEPNETGQLWWETMRNIYPDYFRKETGKGFFTESIDKQLTTTEITDIMQNSNLTGDEQSQMLFGRSEKYIFQANYLALTEAFDDFPEKYLTFDFKQLKENQWSTFRDEFADAIKTAVGQNNLLHVKTVFWGDFGVLRTLKESFDNYCVNTGEALNWWVYLRSYISYLEDHNIIQEENHDTKRGFFM